MCRPNDSNGFLAHEIEHAFGEPWGMIATDASDSENPIRDKAVSSMTHVGMLKTAAVIVGEAVPAFRAVVGIHAIGAGSKFLERQAKGFLNAHDPQEFEEPRRGLHDPEGGLTPYQVALGSKMILKGLQAPSEALHKTHEFIAKEAGDALEALCLTDRNIVEAVKRANRWVGGHPPVPETVP